MSACILSKNSNVEDVREFCSRNIDFLFLCIIFLSIKLPYKEKMSLLHKQIPLQAWQNNSHFVVKIIKNLILCDLLISSVCMNFVVEKLHYVSGDLCDCTGKTPVPSHIWNALLSLEISTMLTLLCNHMCNNFSTSPDWMYFS